VKKKVVVIGGGYGGLRAIEHLALQADMDVTLIDKHPYHYLQTEAYGYIAGRFDLHDVVIDLQDWCSGFKKKVTFIYDHATDIDFASQKVKLCSSEVAYDYLIIATGARTNFFSFIEGLREHSFGVKSLHRAHNFRAEFEKIIYKKLQNEDDAQEINLAIGGAGLSGVEVAAEMANVVAVYKKTLRQQSSRYQDSSHRCQQDDFTRNEQIFGKKYAKTAQITWCAYLDRCIYPKDG